MKNVLLFAVLLISYLYLILKTAGKPNSNNTKFGFHGISTFGANYLAVLACLNLQKALVKQSRESSKIRRVLTMVIMRNYLINFIPINKNIRSCLNLVRLQC